MQKEMKLGPMPVHETRSTDHDTISAMTHPQQAIDESRRMARPKRTIRDHNNQPGYATLLGCSIGEVSKRLDGRWAETLNQIIAWEEATHTRTITQYMAYTRGGLWVPRELSERERAQQRIEELEEQLRQAKGAAA